MPDYLFKANLTSVQMPQQKVRYTVLTTHCFQSSSSGPIDWESFVFDLNETDQYDLNERIAILEEMLQGEKSFCKRLLEENYILKTLINVVGGICGSLLVCSLLISSFNPFGASNLLKGVFSS